MALSPVLWPNEVYWKPSASPADPRYVRTWAEVMESLSYTRLPVKIYVESLSSDAIIPPGGPYNLHGSMFADHPGNPVNNTVVISDGAILLDAGGIDGAVTLELHTTIATVGGTFQYSGALGLPPAFIMHFGANIVNLGSAAAFQIAASVLPAQNYFVIAEVDGGTILPGAYPLLSLGANAVLIATSFSGTSGFPNDFCEGDPTAIIIYQTDGSIADPSTGAMPTLAGFPGFTAYAPVGNAFRGPTLYRPTNPSPLGLATPVGLCYFDTTLGKPVWFNGAAWVLADGTPA